MTRHDMEPASDVIGAAQWGNESLTNWDRRGDFHTGPASDERISPLVRL